MDWAKVYIEMPTDVKLLGRSVSDKWLWTCLILRAHDNDRDRGVVPHDEAEPRWLAKLTGVPTGTVKLALTYFERRGMTRMEECGLRLINYGKRQHRKPSDEPEAVRKRVAQHRSNTSVTLSVTPQKDVSNAPPSRERPTESRDQSTELIPPSPPLPSSPSMDAATRSLERERVTAWLKTHGHEPDHANATRLLISEGWPADVIIAACEVAVAKHGARRPLTYIQQTHDGGSSLLSRVTVLREETAHEERKTKRDASDKGGTGSVADMLSQVVQG